MSLIKLGRIAAEFRWTELTQVVAREYGETLADKQVSVKVNYL